MYQPRNPPSDPKDLPQYLRDEHAAIAYALATQVPFIYLAPTSVAPDKPRNGMMFEAVAPWNPGAGDGTYILRAGAWVKLG